MTSDGELLQNYAEKCSEEAFAELVHRYVDMVHSAALRQTGGNEALARDVSQLVFTDLARKAGTLAGRENLGGWLYTATRFQALNAIRTEQRRAGRDKEAHAMLELEKSDSEQPDWKQIRDVLDEAMHELKEGDREAIILRYFEDLPLSQVSERLGLNEGAARMRVERAMDRLRQVLSRRGIRTAAGLCAALSTHAVQAAPAGLADVLISTSMAAAGVSSASVMTKVVLMTKAKIVTSAVVFAGLAVVVMVQQNSMTRQRTEINDLKQRLATVQNEPHSPAKPVVEVKNLAEDQMRELLRLRGEVTRLQSMARPMPGAVSSVNSKHNSIPGIQVPSSEEGRFDMVRARVMSQLSQMGVAMRVYANDNEDKYATNFADMDNEFGGDVNRREYELRFEMVDAGKLDQTMPDLITFREREARQTPDGKWERAYGMADGSVQMIRSDTGNFEAWEKEHRFKTNE
jgi:RNA polymerase sigma factor (sigma-70 family)